MPYEGLIKALREEGRAKAEAILAKAKTEADQIITEAQTAVEVMERELDTEVTKQGEHQKITMRNEARLKSRQIALQAKHQILDRILEEARRKALQLDGNVREQILTSLLEEVIAAAPQGIPKAVIDTRERSYLEPLLRKHGLEFSVERREDLLLGIELEVNGEWVRSSLDTRLQKAKPELLVELNRLVCGHDPP